jgi:hypothetical protein
MYDTVQHYGTIRFPFLRLDPSLVICAPLLEKEPDSKRFALIPDRSRPVLLHRSSMFPALPADHDPVDPISGTKFDGSDQWFDAQPPHGRLRVFQIGIRSSNAA